MQVKPGLLPESRGHHLRSRPGLLPETHGHQSRRVADLNCLSGITSLGLLRVDGNTATVGKKWCKILH